MSENVYALWKRRFPILKSLRGDVANCQDIVVATAVLHNMGLLWKDENFVGRVGIDPREEDEFVVEDGEENAAARIMRGKHLRDQLRLRMPE
jgi:hypothetical protein